MHIVAQDTRMKGSSLVLTLTYLQFTIHCNTGFTVIKMALWKHNDNRPTDEAQYTLNRYLKPPPYKEWNSIIKHPSK